jgi:hypothetical protein
MRKISTQIKYLQGPIDIASVLPQVIDYKLTANSSGTEWRPRPNFTKIKNL